MVPRMASANYRMADRLAGGTLAELLRTWGREGLSHSAISSRLFAEFGIEATPPTVGAWLRDAADETAADVA